MNISSLELPAGNALFAAYLNRDPQLKPFYPTHFLADPAETFAARAGQEYPRRELVEVLQKQNSGWGATAATLANIGKLADPQTLAVVTGQQAGILGGPLYTFYKILSVLKFSRLFAERHPGYQFVPVFWLEVNDADFAEISKTWYFDRANELKSLLLGENPADALKPIHYRQLDDSPAAWRDTLAEDTVESEFRDAVFDRYFEAYRAGAPIGEAMATLLHGLFGESGLVILNPADPAANRLARPLYERAIRTAGELSTLFGQRSAALAEAGFPAQISHRENQSLLFWVDENQRRMRLDLDGRGGFTANHPDGPRPLSEAELLAVLDTDGQMLSPNVALRPLLQDSLLPTAAYIGGPAEVAYFSQIAALYSHFGMHMPVIMPRHRLTLVESKIQRVLDKLNLSVGQILEGDAGFVADYLRRHAGQELAEGIRSAETQIQDALQKVENLLQEADPTLLNGLEKTRGNIEGSFGKLREKITRSLEQQNGTLVAQLERVQRFLTPEGVPQERLIGAFYFLVKYGPGLLTDLADVLTDDVVRHHVVAL